VRTALKTKTTPSGRGPTTANLFVLAATKRLIKNAFLLAEGISFARFHLLQFMTVVEKPAHTWGPCSWRYVQAEKILKPFNPTALQL
jgi:hypothetical protein